VSSILVKPDGTLVVTVRITLRPGRDDAQIDLVRNAPRSKLAAVIREAMRNGVDAGAVLVDEDDMDLSGLLGAEL
jgi:hypothetical protein